MLTRDDKTLTDAREVYASIAETGLRHVGCKDVGLPRAELQALMDEIRANGHTSHLEVVSETEEATLASARAAAEIGPDFLIGGTLIEPVQESLGVDGINLLAYRYDGDVDALVEAVVGATSLPVIAAGSVDSPARIQALAERGVWAFTIGTAALDGKLVDGGSLDEQLRCALDAATAVV